MLFIQYKLIKFIELKYNKTHEPPGILLVDTNLN